MKLNFLMVKKNYKKASRIKMVDFIHSKKQEFLT
ncbi:hypothetical protein C8C87_2620 [Flavobacterium sp. 120]|nr:hypothetical protein CLV00_1375 [Flavobacterium sp. 11]RKS15283.1 hypothetical protein C8C87_2620 [Flavobacterium sp. 120]